MNFINPFAFLTNYFSRQGDAQNAKIGHVNAVIEELNTIAASNNETYLEVEVTSANILSLYSTGKLLLPSATSGNYNDISKIVIEFNEGSIGYDTTNMGLINLQYGGGTFIDENFISGIYGSERVCIINDFEVRSTDPISSTHVVVSSYFIRPYHDLYLLATNANPTLGDGTMLIKIWYTVRPIGTEL